MGYDIWIETGYDRADNVLTRTVWDGDYAYKHTAEFRLMNDLLMGDWTITRTDRNTIEMRCLSPRRNCQRRVFSRRDPILFPDKPAGWVDTTSRNWPQEQIPK